jgi:hypothetical protein
MGALRLLALVRKPDRQMARRGYDRACGLRRRVSGRARLAAACAVALVGKVCGIRSNGVVLTERGT